MASGSSIHDEQSFSKIRVYIVDDHALIRSGLMSLISNEPDMAVCGQADNSGTALTDIMKLNPDVVLVDISLKGNSGLELIKSIKAYDPRIRTCVLSVHSESVYAMRVLKAGASGYVMKQEVVTKVLDAIRQVRNGGVFVSNNVLNQMLYPLHGGSTRDPVGELSDRELEIATLLGRGMATREIAAYLHVSIKTVETHRANIKKKLNLRNGRELLQFCVRWVDDNHTQT